MQATSHTTKPTPGTSATRRSTPNPAKNAPTVRFGVRPLTHSRPITERGGDVAQRREHVERRDHPDPERDPHDRHEDERREERAHDAHEGTPTERGPDPLPGRGRHLGGAGEHEHEHQAEHRDRHRHRDPEEREEGDDQPGEDVLEVDPLHVAGDGAAPRHGREARDDVAADVRAVVDDHPARHCDHVAADPAGDVDVAVGHEHVAGDPAVDAQVAVADEQVVVDGAVDAAPFRRSTPPDR